MKHLRLSFIILIAVPLVGIIGWFIGVYSASTVNEQVSQTLVREEKAYLSQRFQTAYEGMEPMVAIWEGTNLIAYLKRFQTNDSASQQELASEILLNSRLSALFKETGRSDQAHYFSEEALTLFHRLAGSAASTPDQVVEKTLEVESVKRHYIKKCSNEADNNEEGVRDD
jgi:hypothetical protein